MWKHFDAEACADLVRASRGTSGQASDRTPLIEDLAAAIDLEPEEPNAPVVAFSVGSPPVVVCAGR